MEFEEQSAALRQMKELLRDQTKFRAKLDRVVRKIETSSQRTARLAERNKARKNAKANQNNGNGDGLGHNGASGSDESHGGEEMHAAAATFVPGAS